MRYAAYVWFLAISDRKLFVLLARIWANGSFRGLSATRAMNEQTSAGASQRHPAHNSMGLSSATLSAAAWNKSVLSLGDGRRGLQEANWLSHGSLSHEFQLFIV